MTDHRDRLGFIGTGNMGFPMAVLLLEAGFDVSVWNRTRTKAEPLAQQGATVVDRVTDLADRDIVFTMVADPATLLSVTIGADGLLSAPEVGTKILIDSSTIDAETSSKVRVRAAELGTELLAAPVSGNGKVVKAGRLSVAVSGPHATFERALPYLSALGSGVTYVGEGELARTVKIAHNVLLGVVTQTLAEITVLAEKGGVDRRAFLDFINNSVMGSVFTKYKSPAFINLNFKATFTPPLLKKDLDLGLEAGHALGVPMPVTAATREAVQSLIGKGHTTDDFATLLLQTAEGAGWQLHEDPEPVDDGLAPRTRP